VAPRDRTGRQPEVPPEVPPEYADEYLAAFHRALAEAGVPMMRESDDARTVPPAEETQDHPDVVVGEVVAPAPPPAPAPPAPAAPVAEEPPATEAFETVALAPDDEPDEPDDEADDEPDEPVVERMEVWAFEPPERDPDEIFPPQPPPPAKWDFEAPREPVEDPLPPRWDFEPPPEPDPDWEFEEAPALPLDWAFEPVEDETGELAAVGDDTEVPAAQERYDDEPPARRGRPLWIYVLVFLVVAAVLMVSAYFLGMALSSSTGSAPAVPVTGSAGV
jgi:hypothetical protein